jgi:hypothetical protein
MTVAPAETVVQRRRRSERDLLLLALLFLGDADDGVLQWDTYAPRPYRGLLKASVFDNVRDEAGELPPFWFDVETQRFGISRRGFIPMKSIFAAFDQFIANVGRAASASVASVFAGGDLDTWQSQMEQQSRATAVASTLLAVGGVDGLTDDYLSAASKGLQFPLKRLERFASQIDAGIVTAESAGRRAAMYSQAIATGTGGFDGIRRMSHAAASFLLEANVLDPVADHCTRRIWTPPDLPSCPELTRLGWVPINTMALPGLRICRWNCRCHMRYARTTQLEN